MSLLARLIEAGTPADLVAEVARELARAEVAQEAIEQRRSKDRERQQRRRDNVTSRDTADVTETTPPSAPPNDIYSTPPHHPPQHTIGARDDFPCPDWCEAEVWRDLKRNRKTKKLTNTPTAHKRFVDAVEAMADDEWPPGRLVEAIAALGWGGAHDPRKNRNPNNDNRRQGNSNQRTADLAAEKLRGLQ